MPVDSNMTYLTHLVLQKRLEICLVIQNRSLINLVQLKRLKACKCTVRCQINYDSLLFLNFETLRFLIVSRCVAKGKPASAVTSLARHSHCPAFLALKYGENFGWNMPAMPIVGHQDPVFGGDAIHLQKKAVF